jgi:hypothetical protein
MHKVAVVLRDGSMIDNVEVAWGRDVVRIGVDDDFDLPLDDIVGVIDRS